MTWKIGQFPYETVDWLTECAKKLGFSSIGVTQSTPSEHETYFKDWLKAGRHGEMSYLAENLDLRLNAENLLKQQDAQGDCTVLCVTDPYWQPKKVLPDSEGPRARIARYGMGDDYHKKLKKRLFQLADELKERFSDASFRCAVDTAPVMEREHAGKAGLGWIGKHTLLIHPERGSYFFIGAILCNVPIGSLVDASPQVVSSLPQSHCGTCMRCIDACPTDCIEPEGYKMDAASCISYLTLEHRSTIPHALKPLMGDWLAGCDICQEVCPYNQPERDASLNILSAYEPREALLSLNPMDVLRWTEADRREILKASALKRMKLPMLKRNALIVLANQIHVEIADEAQAIARSLTQDEDEMVVDAAEYLLGQIDQLLGSE